MEFMIQGHVLVPGSVKARLLASTEPLSFWGGYDQVTGEIIDRRHPLSGENGAGKILAIPFTRGSSTTTGILIESVRAGVAPAAIVTSRTDSFLALASIVAGELYDQSFPVISIDPEKFSLLKSGMEVEIGNSGELNASD